MMIQKIVILMMIPIIICNMLNHRAADANEAAMGKRENRTGVSLFSAVSARGGAQSIHAE